MCKRKNRLCFVMAAMFVMSIGSFMGCGKSSQNVGDGNVAGESRVSEENVPEDNISDEIAPDDVPLMEDMSQFDSYGVAFEDMTRGEGVYVVEADKTRATRLWDEPSHMKVDYFDGTDYTVENADYDGNTSLDGAYVESIADEPAQINISEGEMLALVLPYDPYIRMFEGTFIGYGHYDKSDNMTGYEEIAGVDLSDVETIADVNERLVGTDLRFREYERSSGSTDALLLSETRGEEVTLGTYVGTSFEEETYDFNNAFYLFPASGMQKPEIEKTKDGYFVVNLSGMAPGIYYLDIAANKSSSGIESFIIEIL